MLNDKINNQEGGENSNNIQGQLITINQGITYQDAKDIALDVFKANYLELAAKAADTAKQRAEELIDDFLRKMKERNPQAINSMENPGMQYAIFTAQKEYAKTGDKDLSDILVDILVDRAAQEERNLKQIVLDESLSIVPKLTLSQMDSLTIIFMLSYASYSGITSLPLLKQWLEEHISPFTSLLSKEDSLYQHLEFTACASIGFGWNNIEELILKRYKGIFCKGFTKEQFETTGIQIDKYPSIIIPCLEDNSKFKLAAIDDEAFQKIAKKSCVQEAEINKLKPLMDNYQMNATEVKDFLKQQGDFMNSLFEVWDNSPLKSVTLTSVGIAVAIANLRRKTDITADLGIWIK
jgi:hypothetical protein